MFSISQDNQSSTPAAPQNNLNNDIQAIVNDFDYDDKISLSLGYNPPTINKGGLNTHTSKTALPNVTPPTFSCIVDWVGFVFDIEASFRIDRAEQAQTRADFEAGKINAIQSQDNYLAIHNIQDKAQHFLNELSKFVPLLTFHLSGHGRFAYKYMADLYRDGEHVGTFSFGGETNKGTAALMLKGKGCSGVEMYQLRRYLESFPGAHLTRVDVAHDDLEGIKPIDYYVSQFYSGNFYIKGARPKPRNGGDWTSDNDEKGRTFYVGSKRNGKEACIYEKGKQLGDPLSSWVRVEVRFTHDDHELPFDILTSPEMYFAGSYPVLEDTCIFHERCAVIKKHAEIALESLIGHARTAYGKLINIMVEIGRSPEKIVSDLIADGTPKRLVLPLPPMPQVQHVGAMS